MPTTTTVLLNQTLSRVTTYTTTIDTSAVNDIAFSCTGDENISAGMWLLSRVDTFGAVYLFQEGPLFPGDFSMNIGPSAAFDVTQGLGDAIQLDIINGDGTSSVTLCVTGKAYA